MQGFEEGSERTRQRESFREKPAGILHHGLQDQACEGLSTGVLVSGE